MPNPIRPERWFWLVFTLVLAWVLYPFWLESHVPAFRDGFHFYYPQSVWLDECYERGDTFPKWNPNEGLGSSVVGQPTWQLYYPLRVAWLLPGLDVAQRLALFIAVHLLLAAVGVWRVGQLLQWSHSTRWFAAIAFSLSCPVLFQLNNLIYLCSATWVAWGLLPVLRLVCSADSSLCGIHWRFYGRILCETCVAGCLMTLAGDPHGAVNFGIIVCCAWAYRGWLSYFGEPAKGCIASPSSNHGKHPSFRQLCLPAVAVLLFALTVWQTQDALRWYRLSSRASAQVACNDSFHPVVDQILKDTTLVQPQRIFDFSLSPWSLPTVFWPTWAGHFQPTHSRWVQAIPSEGRMWIPSLYLGILPVTFALWVIFGNRQRQAIDRFFVGLCLIVTLFAMGNFSPVWLLRNMLDALGATGVLERLPTDAQGSFYGLLTNFIPGYAGFRYPAKWSVWIIACLSVLAARGLDRLCENGLCAAELNRWLVRFIGISGLVLVIVVMLVTYQPSSIELQSWLAGSTDPMLGTPDPEACVKAIVRSLMQPMLVLVAFVGLLKWLNWRPSDSKTKADRLSWIVVLLLLIDLASLSAQWTTSVTAPVLTASEVTAHQECVGRSAVLAWANPSRAEIREIRQRMSDQIQSTELPETLQLQQLFLLGKLNHLHGLAALHSSGSIEPQAIIVLKRWLQRNDDMQEVQLKLDSVLRALGVGQRLIHDPSGQLVWKEVESTRPLCEFIADGDDTGDRCKWNWLSSDDFEVEIDASRSGSLLVRQLNDGGWRASSATVSEIEIAANELFIVCSLTAGRHRVTISRK